VGIVTLAGLALRLPSFGDSLFGDEVGAYWIVAGHSLGRVIYYMGGHPPSPELNPPLWFVLAWFSTKVFGLSAWSLKLLSLLCGTATIPLTYLLGRFTAGVRTGLAAAAIVALSPFLIYYSTEARPYALLVFLSLASTLALLRAVHGGRPGWWVLYAVCACGVAYTHFTGVFLLGAQFLWALVAYPSARRRLLLATGAAAVGFLPWLPALIRTSHSPGVGIYGFLDRFDLHSIRVDLGRWAVGHPYLTVSRIPGDLAVGLILAGAVVAAVAGLIRFGATRPAVTRDLALVPILALAAPVGIALYSIVHVSVWDSRNIISSWPGFAVLLGALATYPRLPWRAAAVSLILAGFLLGALKLSQSANQRPDYDSAAAFIDRSPAVTAPVVDLAAPTPGPPTETEAALALERPGERHTVLRLGLPPLAEVLRVPAYSNLPVPSGLAVGRQAAALAGQGELFLVAATDLSIRRLQALRKRHLVTGAGPLADFVQFLGALPARFQPITSRTYPGLAPVTVYVYRG
jgi:Dolichyl-phosphate-mannose-protein mannosyltransferase